MEFKSLKNIESSFRQIRLFGIVILSLIYICRGSGTDSKISMFICSMIQETNDLKI